MSEDVKAPRDEQMLRGDRAHRALIDGVLHAVGGSTFLGAGHAFGIELEDIRAHLGAESAPHAEILIYFRHVSSFHPHKIRRRIPHPQTLGQPRPRRDFHRGNGSV